MSRARDIANLIGGATPDIILKTSDGAILELQTSDTTVTDGSVLGKINFTAPDEASGTDALLVGASIEAVAEGTFAADNNATEIVFKTGASEAAAEKMKIASTGAITTTASAGHSFSSTSRHVLSLVSTDASASDGPRFILQRDSASPADNDNLGVIEFYGEDDGDNATEYARIYAYATDVSDGAEDGALGFSTKIANSTVSRLWIPSTESIFNENSADLDFRVESNDNANMLFVDGGNNCVSIGTTTNHGGELNIETTGQASSIVLACTDTDANEGPILDLRRDAGNVPSDNDAMGIINFQNDNTDLVMHTYASIASFVDDVSAGTEDGVLRFNSIVDGTMRNRIDIIPAGVVINEDSIDSDFRVESNGNANMLVVDGGNDAVYVGTSSEYSGTAATATITPQLDIGDTSLSGTSAIHFVATAATGVIGGLYGKWTGYGNGGYIKFHADNVGGGSQTASLIFGTTVNNSTADRFNIAGNGDLTATDTSIGSISDERLKESIADFTYDMAKFKQLKARSYKWKNPIYHGNRVDTDGKALTSYGTIAQEVAAVDADYVRDYEIKDEVNSDKDLLDSDNIAKTTTLTGKEHAMYISIIQQLISKVETLETKVEALEGG